MYYIRFIQNHATGSGSTLYGGLLDRCAISTFAEVQKVGNYREGNANGLTYFNGISVFTNISLFSKVCICADNDSIVCTQRYDISKEVRKGEVFILRVVTVDQAGHPVDATIQSSLKHASSGLDEGHQPVGSVLICHSA